MQGRRQHLRQLCGQPCALALAIALALLVLPGCTKRVAMAPAPASLVGTREAAPLPNKQFVQEAPSSGDQPSSPPRRKAARKKAAKSMTPQWATYEQRATSAEVAAASQNGTIVTDYVCVHTQASLFAYNVPERMQLSSPSVEIRLVLGHGEDDPRVTAAFKTGQTVETGTVVTQPNMRAVLNDPDKAFRIEAVDPADQPHCKPHLTTWRWRITPVLLGRHSLYLQITPTTSRHGDMGPGEQTVVREITVEVVNAWDLFAWVRINWTSIVGVAGTLGAGLAYLLKLRKSAKGQDV